MCLSCGTDHFLVSTTAQIRDSEALAAGHLALTTPEALVPIQVLSPHERLGFCTCWHKQGGSSVYV